MKKLQFLFKSFIKWLPQLILPFLIFACDSNDCYYRPGVGQYTEANQVVRADGIKLPMGTSGQGTEPIPYNEVTGVPDESLPRGQWQDVVNVTKGKKIGMMVRGDIYLSKVEQTVVIDFNNPSKITDIQGNPLTVKSGDLIIVSKDNNSSTKFRSVAGFDNNYLNYMSDGYVTKPANGTDFNTFYNNTISSGIINIDQKFIGAFNYCRNKVDDSAFEGYFKTPRQYPTLTKKDLLNCFHYDGRGLAILVNGKILKDSSIPFISTGGFVPSKFLANAPEEKKIFYPFDYSPDQDSMVYHVMKVDNDGQLQFVLDKNFFSGATYYVGNYRLKITRYTDLKRHGERMKIVVAESGMDLNSNGFDINDAKNKGKLIEYEPIYEKGEFVSQLTGKLWVQIFDQNYYDNLDQYYLTVRQIDTNTTWTGVYNDFIKPLRKTLYQVVEQTYSRTVTDYRFQRIVKLMMILSLIVYIISYILGFIRESQYEFIGRLFKLAVVTILISENSWSFFHDNLFILFQYGTDQLLTLTNVTPEYAGPFSWMDDLMYVLLNEYLGYRLASLLIMGPFGILMILIILYGVLCLIMITVRTFLIYCLMMICTAFLISVSPLFIACLLFKRTSQLFSQWWQLTAYFTFAPFIIMLGAILIVNIINSFVDKILGKQVCWGDTVYVYLYILGFIKIKLFTLRWMIPDRAEYGFRPTEYIVGQEVDPVAAMTFFTFILKILIDTVIFVMLVKVIEHYVQSAERFCATLFGTFRGGTNASDAINKVIGVGKSVAMAVISGGKDGLKKVFSGGK